MASIKAGALFSDIDVKKAVQLEGRGPLGGRFVVRRFLPLESTMRGWVYVITNNAMPGLVKVGFSRKDPNLRAKELNHTGAPHPYIVAYDAMVYEPRDIEQKVHSDLSRVREGKEWFRCSLRDAIASIRSVVRSGVLMEPIKNPDGVAAQLSPATKPKGIATYADNCAYCGTTSPSHLLVAIRVLGAPIVFVETTPRSFNAKS
jgi:hypothetical protein